DITPVGSVFLYGYPHVKRWSTGVHDPLLCSALYLRQGDNATLLLANDLIAVSKSLVADVRRRISQARNLPEHAILVSATHTHSGPVTMNHATHQLDNIIPKADVTYLAYAAD